MARVVEHAKRVGKPIVLERLDFRQKKAALEGGSNCILIYPLIYSDINLMERRLLKIGAAAALGTTPGQLRKWEQSGELLPTRKTKGGTRYYAVSDLLGVANESAPTVCYARVSSHDQKADLDRQHAVLEAYCAAKGWRSEVIRDLGSGMNYRKKGLQRLLDLILRRQMKRLVLAQGPPAAFRRRVGVCFV